MTTEAEVIENLRTAMNSAALDMAQMGLAMSRNEVVGDDEIATWEAVHRFTPPLGLPPEVVAQATATAGMRAVTGSLLRALEWVDRKHGRDDAEALLLHLRDTV